MNYRHIYHAGNFADIFKHVVLTVLLTRLKLKKRPFCYLDTHAGLGKYNLRSQETEKTKEYVSGVSRLLDSDQANCPPEVLPYLELLKSINHEVGIDQLNGENILVYPGSPLLAKHLVRPNDRIILMELHPEDVLDLKKLFFQDPQVAVHHYDGYQGIKAFLPPKEKRGLLFIDPPFEQKNEFELIINSLQVALTKWPTGVYAVWYPIKDLKQVDSFLAGVENFGNSAISCKFMVDKPSLSKNFIGCGVYIINPPWQTDLILDYVNNWLWPILDPERSGRVDMISQYY